MSLISDSKIVWQFLKKYKKKVFFISSIAVIGSIVSASIPYLYGRLVDYALMPVSAIKILGGFILLWLILAFLEDWMKRFVFLQGSHIGIDAGNDFFVKIAKHLIDLPLSYHKHQKMGEVMQRIDRGSNFLEMITINVVFSTLPGFLTVIGALAVMGFVEWRIMLLFIVVLFFYAVAVLWKTRLIVVSQKKLNKHYEKVYGSIYDAILNIQTVKSFSNEAIEKRKLDKDLHEKIGSEYKIFMRLWKNLRVWQQSIFDLGFISIFALSVYFLRAGYFTAGELIMFIGYVRLAQNPFDMLAQNYRMLSSGLTAIHRSLSLLEEDTERYNPASAIVLKNLNGDVEFQNVDFKYKKDEKTVLKNINFTAKAGEMVALVGESGVGKSTLTDLISAYYFPAKGKILVDGQDISKVDLHSLRKNIAIVPQEVILFNDTVKNNIRYGKQNATDEEVIKAAKVAHAHEFIEGFSKKYNQIVGERGIKLSTGQKQRIAIARAILRNPKILILDEATASLDSETEKLVQESLSYLMKGRTTFVIAHRLSTIQEADKIFVLEKGSIIEEGDHAELITHGGVYKKLCELQSTVLKG